jgi:hypothetical protein
MVEFIAGWECGETGDDEGKGKRNGGSPSWMTERKGNGKGRFPSGMTTKEVTVAALDQ